MSKFLILSTILLAICACQEYPLTVPVEEPVNDEVIVGGPTSFEAVNAVASWEELATGTTVTGNHTETLTAPKQYRLIPYRGYTLVEWQGITASGLTITVQPGTVLVRAILAPSAGG